MEVDADMSRALKTFRRVPRYGHAVGRIMVHEAKRLNWQRIERLLDSGFEECLDILKETDYGPYLEGSTVAGDVDEALLRFLQAQYLFVDEICAGTKVAEMLHLRYDVHNIKVLLKARYFGGSDAGMMPGLGALDVERVRTSLAKTITGNLPRFWEDLLAKAVKVLEESPQRSPDMVDTILDRMYLERFLELSRLERSRFLVSYARAAIDAANLRVLLRGRELGRERDYYLRALADGGRIEKFTVLELSAAGFDQLSAKLLAGRYGRMLEGVLKLEGKSVRLTSLDRDSDEYLLEKLGSLGRVSVGPERIIMYVIGRENEVVLLRTILMGKLHNLPPREIEEQVSPVYLTGGAWST